MRPNTYPLNIPASPGTGTATPVADLVNITVQITGTWAGTVLVEATCDGVEYETIGSLTTHGITVFPVGGTFAKVRVNTTSASALSGVVATLLGRDARSDQ